MIRFRYNKTGRTKMTSKQIVQLISKLKDQDDQFQRWVRRTTKGEQS